MSWDEVLVNEDNVLDLMEKDLASMVTDELDRAALEAAEGTWDGSGHGGVDKGRSGLPIWEGLDVTGVLAEVDVLQEELVRSRRSCEHAEHQLDRTTEALASARLLLWRSGVLADGDPDGQASKASKDGSATSRLEVLRESAILSGRAVQVTVSVAKLQEVAAADPKSKEKQGGGNSAAARSSTSTTTSTADNNNNNNNNSSSSSNSNSRRRTAGGRRPAPRQQPGRQPERQRRKLCPLM